MKKVICKKTYDTETATLIKAYSFSQLGDPAGYEEDLYQTPVLPARRRWRDFHLPCRGYCPHGKDQGKRLDGEALT